VFGLLSNWSASILGAREIQINQKWLWTGDGNKVKYGFSSTFRKLGPCFLLTFFLQQLALLGMPVASFFFYQKDHPYFSCHVPYGEMQGSKWELEEQSG
jgi:hypothetical protein